MMVIINVTKTSRWLLIFFFFKKRKKDFTLFCYCQSLPNNVPEIHYCNGASLVALLHCICFQLGAERSDSLATASIRGR